DEKEKSHAQVEHHQEHDPGRPECAHFLVSSFSVFCACASLSCIGICAILSNDFLCHVRHDQIQMPMKTTSRTTVMTPASCPHSGFMADPMQPVCPVPAERRYRH